MYVSTRSTFTKSGRCWSLCQLSQQTLDALKRVDGNFVFQQDSALAHIAFNTVKLVPCKTPNFFSWATVL